MQESGFAKLNVTLTNRGRAVKREYSSNKGDAASNDDHHAIMRPPITHHRNSLAVREVAL